MGGGKDPEFLATNPANAREGDTVLLDFKTSMMLKLSFLLYVFPVIVLITGAVIGDNWARSTGIDPSIGAAGFGFAGFFLAIGLILFLEKGAKQKDKYKPVIISIKKRAAAERDSTGDVPKCSTCH